jgi:hypothetical protein
LTEVIKLSHKDHQWMSLNKRYQIGYDQPKSKIQTSTH